MERKIGEKFTQGLDTLKVVREDQNHWCIGCYYNHGGLSDCFFKDTLSNRGECRIGHRSDNSGVVFKETFLSRNLRPITYISIILLSGVFWYFIFKIILGL